MRNLIFNKTQRKFNFWTFILSLIVSSTLIQACDSRPKTQDITLTYLIKDNTLYYNRVDGSTFIGIHPRLEVSTTITNTSDYGGVFKFFAKISSQGNVIEFNDEQFIASGQTITFSQTKDIEHFSFQKNIQIDSWGIIAPIKTIPLK